MTGWLEPGLESAPPMRRRRLRRTWPERILLTLSVLCVLSLVTAAVGLAWGLRRFQAINFVPVAGVESNPPGEPSNWLLVGSDSREGIDPDDPNAAIFVGEAVEGKRTDTIIVARVDPAQQQIDLLSVPRDLWVPIHGTGANGRINSAFNGEGGEERLVATVENFLDIEINNYAEVNFVGFQAVIDAIGGVPIWFDTPVRDAGSGLNVTTPGCHTLGGFEALAFARSRKLEFQDAGGTWRSDPTGDLGRTARQQHLLARLADTASDRLDVTNLGTVDRILQAGGENLIVDDGAGAGDLLNLARTFSAVGSAGITSHALPVSGFRTSGGASVLALDEAAAQPTLDVFRPSVPPPEVAEVVARNSFSVDVRNGARIAGIAGETADELTAAGFVVGEVGNAETVPTTTIRYPAAGRDAAGTLAAVLHAPVRFEADDSLTNVELVIGPDFAGVVGVTPAPTTVPPSSTTVPEALAAAPDNVVGVVPGPAPAGTECA
ncbi:MAG: LCP family protein [Actinomycetota bacterium]